MHIGCEVGAGKGGDQKLDRKAQPISFGTAERGDGAHPGRVRIRCRSPLCVHGPIGRDGHTPHCVMVDLAHGDDARREIEDEVLIAGRDSDGDGIGAQHRLRSAERVNERLAGRHDDADEAAPRRRFRVIGEHANMVGVADRGDGDPRLVHDGAHRLQGVRNDHRTEAAFAIDAEKRAPAPRSASMCLPIGQALFQP